MNKPRRSLVGVSRIALLAILAFQSACFYAHGAIGAATPVSGALDRGAQTRFAGTWAPGTGYIGKRGGAAAGVLLEYLAPADHHAAFGGWGLVAVHPTPWLQIFGRATVSESAADADGNCTPQQCATSMGFAIGAHLIHISDDLVDDDGHEAIADAPKLFGIGLALSYQRVNLDGDLGHYLGLELSVIGGGAITSSRRY